MMEDWRPVRGVVVIGHQVASRRSDHYPRGTIEMQIPFFKERGLDLSPYYHGTLNISISPLNFRMVEPEHTFRHVRWTTAHPPEDFSFSHCRVNFKDIRYEGWVYYPHPETKERHFQDPSIIEVIAPEIPEINYGDRVEIEIKSNSILLFHSLGFELGE
jgi:CTP-dependent riboflavin kinase